MLPIHFLINKQLKRDLFAIRNIYRRFSSNDASSKKLSYFHQKGEESLKFLNVGQMLKHTAETYPNRESIVSCSENLRLTFAETLYKSDRLASGLLNLGLSKGDFVAIWSPNFEFWYVSMLAIARAGLICVSLNPAYQLPELKYCINKVKVKAIIAPESFRNQKHYEMLTSFLPGNSNNDPTDKTCLQHIIIHSDKKMPGVIQYDELMKISSENEVARIENLQPLISPDSPCSIQFSSGTTGQPKAAVLSHFSFINNANSVGILQELDKNYRRICLNNPFFHAYGTVVGIVNSIVHGSTLVLPAPHFNPEESLKTIVKEKCDVIYGTPTMFVDLVAAQRKLEVDLPEVEFANTGGSIITPKLVKDVEKVLKVKNFRSIYGLTETTVAAFQSLPTDKNESIQEYVGKLKSNMEAKIIDDSGVVVPFGHPGELCLRGYNIMAGYFNDEKKTKETFAEGNWFKTGDQFILHENGYGKIVGRLKDMIIRGGENLFPREIEDFLNTHPDILETHVIGIPDERMGEEVGAFIRLKELSKLLTRNDIKAFCSGNISHFKVPRFVVVVDDFPRTLSGKVQKFKFLELFQNELKACKALG